MRFILGKKIEMSQLFNEKGDVVPVTLVQAGPCTVVQVKNKDKDGYIAVQVGFDKKKKLSAQLKGHLKGLDDFRWLREFRIKNERLAITENTEKSTENTEKKSQSPQRDSEPSVISGDILIKRGDVITVNTFEVGDKIKVTANSKGKGFQGVVKRHGFHGQHASHGTKDQVRAPGSIGATEPARVFKGMKMPGHMGNEKVTVKNLEIAKIEPEKNLLYIKGAVPGARGSLVMIQGEGEFKVNMGKDKKTANTENTEKTQRTLKKDKKEKRKL